MTGVAVVTGASRGIGAATALLAAEYGYKVCVNYAQSEAAAADLVARIEAAGGTALAVQGDVAVEADVMRLFETCDAELGPLTALVNNAGVIDLAQRVDEMSYDRLMRMMSINVIGSFLCAREAVRRMSTRHGGAGGGIVNLSSVAARLGGPGAFVDYAASKGAIDSFTYGLALEVAREGIRVNSVRPGIIDTEIHASAGFPDRVAQMRSAVPMGREGTAAEVAKTILWLLSDKSSYTTGTVVEVSGGR